MPEQQIYAAYDDAGIYVYQAYKPSIVRAALEKGTFGAGFNRDRMTWIKPSFGWMLYRSGYATKTRQQAILKIKLTHNGFRDILQQAVLTHFAPEIYASEDEWRQRLKRSRVRVQWDPERHLRGHKLERRAIQIGIRGRTVYRYVDEWIIGLEDVTDLAHTIHQHVKMKQPLDDLVLPDERLYPVDDELAAIIGTESV
ncbi:MAG: DUF4291 domain-containing protein [Aggregatilineales bacterium]